MKNPLRYAVAEGLVVIFYFPSDKTPGNTAGRFLAAPPLTFNLSGKTFIFEKTEYHLSIDFYLDYGIRVKSRDAAVVEAGKWLKNLRDIREEFDYQCYKNDLLLSDLGLK